MQAVVGVNTWVAHRNTEIFGSDAEHYRPERWLEADKDQLSRMEEYYLPVCFYFARWRFKSNQSLPLYSSGTAHVLALAKTSAFSR